MLGHQSDISSGTLCLVDSNEGDIAWSVAVVGVGVVFSQTPENKCR